MTGTLRAPRSRGALSGLLLVLLGIWGALIPFVGPYFHFAYTPDRTWYYDSGRLWLEVLPGLAALVGGVFVLISRLRPVAVFGAWLAGAGGAWYVVGGLIAHQWTSLPGAGSPVGGPARTAAEQIAFFLGLGVVIVFFAGAAMGRFSVVGARDVVRSSGGPVEEVPEPSVPATTVPASTDSASNEPVTSGGGLGSLPRRLRLSSPVVRSGNDGDETEETAPVESTTT
jgi:hypothetical protein